VVNPVSAALGGAAGSTTETVTIATSVAGAELRWPGEKQLVWAAGLVPLLWLRRRRLRRAAILCGLVLLAGCQASRIIPATGLGGGGGVVVPTPSGTYNVVVSGASAGLVRTVGLVVVVQ
jgi:hypothetical protein